MFDFIGKRFCGYLVTLVAGYLGAAFILDGVQLVHFYDFAEKMFGIYVSGQTVSDTMRHFRGGVDAR